MLNVAQQVTAINIRLVTIKCVYVIKTNDDFGRVNSFENQYYTTIDSIKGEMCAVCVLGFTVTGKMINAGRKFVVLLWEE